MDGKKKIVEMVSDGKISPREAEKLLSALEPKKNINNQNQKLIIKITNESENKVKLNMALPLKLMKLGLKFIPNQEKLHADIGTTNFDFSQISWREILEMAAAGETEDLFYMNYEEDDGSISTIRIFVE